jgi:hypothetical protein
MKKNQSIIEFVIDNANTDDFIGVVASGFANDKGFLRCKNNLEGIAYIFNNYKHIVLDDIGRTPAVVDFVDEFINPIGIKGWEKRERQEQKEFDKQTSGFSFHP